MPTQRGCYCVKCCIQSYEHQQQAIINDMSSLKLLQTCVRLELYRVKTFLVGGSPLRARCPHVSALDRSLLLLLYE